MKNQRKSMVPQVPDELLPAVRELAHSAALIAAYLGYMYRGVTLDELIEDRARARSFAQAGLVVDAWCRSLGIDRAAVGDLGDL